MDDHTRIAEIEAQVYEELRKFAALAAQLGLVLAEGGWVMCTYLDLVREEMDRIGFATAVPSTAKPKAKISNALRKEVMERDRYRCVTCGTHLDLSVDHIVPESKGGKTVLDNLQTMCVSDNRAKGDR